MIRRIQAIDRTSWGRQFDRCWLCDRREGDPSTLGGFLALQTHELVGNSRRRRALAVPAAWFRVCQYCHQQLSSSPPFDEIVELLAIKLMFDRENYDLLEVNKLLSPNRRGGWDDGPVTQAEVEEASTRLYGPPETRTAAMMERIDR